MKDSLFSVVVVVLFFFHSSVQNTTFSKCCIAECQKKLILCPVTFLGYFINMTAAVKFCVFFDHEIKKLCVPGLPHTVQEFEAAVK